MSHAAVRPVPGVFVNALAKLAYSFVRGQLDSVAALVRLVGGGPDRAITRESAEP